MVDYYEIHAVEGPQENTGRIDVRNTKNEATSLSEELTEDTGYEHTVVFHSEE